MFFLFFLFFICVQALEQQMGFLHFMSSFCLGCELNDRQNYCVWWGNWVSKINKSELGISCWFFNFLFAFLFPGSQFWERWLHWTWSTTQLQCYQELVTWGAISPSNWPRKISHGISGPSQSSTACWSNLQRNSAKFCEGSLQCWSCYYQWHYHLVSCSNI